MKILSKSKLFVATLASIAAGTAASGATPTPLTTPVGVVQWVEGGSYYWRTAGNHSNHSSLTMTHTGTDAVVTVVYEDLYTDTETYTINLSQGTIAAQLYSYYGKTDRVDMSVLPLGSHVNAALVPLAEVMIGRIKDLAAGYNAAPYGSAPAAPELEPLIQALQTATGSN